MRYIGILRTADSNGLSQHHLSESRAVATQRDSCQRATSFLARFVLGLSFSRLCGQLGDSEKDQCTDISIQGSETPLQTPLTLRLPLPVKSKGPPASSSRKSGIPSESADLCVGNPRCRFADAAAFEVHSVQQVPETESTPGHHYHLPRRH
ncbi:hypothetical protein BV22DRAFT_910673 [Leucogyrophana mollusca]|uniref:Uncharacterized protein n=1 Tax=Leucogyrophana mollusca TaxID=85980 RepID=A0ACB8AYF5_9AGAM|nr:hypothetical protein BV22DRAFT_910673 [Leucogyrophana mollusca]